MAIHKYIADKWQPELLGKDEQTRGHVNMVSYIVNDYISKQSEACYRKASVEEAKAACKEADDTFLPKLVAFRDDRKFLCANEVTWVDFYFFERL